MEYRNLGATGLRVSTLCLGAMIFGDADEESVMHEVGCDEKTSFEIMNRALDAGLNFIDTADVYGKDGLSERVLGKWFEQQGKRDRVVLATKFRFRTGDGPNGTGAARYRLVKTVEDSLRRLRTDRIDLYQIHMQDLDTPEDETLRALDDLVRQGKVLYLGCSNYTAYRLVHSQWVSKTRNLERFVSLQAQYSLVVREIEREHVSVCRDFGIGLLPWSPLAGGFLTGKYQRGQELPAGTRMERWKQRYKSFDRQRNWRILDAVTAVAGELGATPAQVALAWLLHKPQVTSVIFGARSVAQLEDNLAAAALKLSEEHMTQLDAASSFELGNLYQFLSNVQKRW